MAEEKLNCTEIRGVSVDQRRFHTSRRKRAVGCRAVRVTKAYRTVLHYQRCCITNGVALPDARFLLWNGAIDYHPVWWRRSIASGNVNANLEPCPTRLSNQILPP